MFSGRRVEEDQRLIERPRRCSGGGYRCRGRRYPAADRAAGSDCARCTHSGRSRLRSAGHVTEVRVIVVLVPLVTLRIGAAQARIARRFACSSWHRALAVVVFVHRVVGVVWQKRRIRFGRESGVVRRRPRFDSSGAARLRVSRCCRDCRVGFHGRAMRWIPAFQPCLGTCERGLLQTVRRLSAAVLARGKLRERTCRGSAQSDSEKRGDVMLDGPSFHDAVSGAIKVPTRPRERT